MMFPTVLGLIFLVSLSHSECFIEKILGAHLVPKGEVSEKLEITDRLQSVLQQWYDIRREDLKCSLVTDIELCQYHSVEQALLLNGLIRLEELSLIKHIPSEMYASASVLSSSLLFPGGKYCFIGWKTGAKVLEKASCDVFFRAVADELGFAPEDVADLMASGVIN